MDCGETLKSAAALTEAAAAAADMAATADTAVIGLDATAAAAAVAATTGATGPCPRMGPGGETSSKSTVTSEASDTPSRGFSCEYAEALRQSY